ncbi:propanediol/glycerol family dehydratase large subunit [Cetobacterium sp.]|uniref:propanediol/glycerol family dehydratase large subunit n=1 Tax=Cetobacterium sp. TaxID=2071632 RepID=UPI0025C1F637|nr:propanediol/glycerol family dehydratase large subunit [Cetobacterium sp.]
MRSKRFEVLSERAVNKDGFIGEWKEEGLIAMDSPLDPKSSLAIKDGKIIELDGKKREDFDMIDLFIADYAIDLRYAEEAMKLSTLEIAKKLVDINVKKEDILKITTGITPAKMVEVISHLNVVEMMMAVQKMRARKTPSNQCHVTNLRDNPVQIAADAAEAAIRGFDEQETTVGIVRYAPFNAIAIFVGSQVGRGGVLTQCSVEEATELELGMKGFTSYAETVSVYGTEQVFTDGDDTPWSKAFLASAYASRGLKMRFTSGTGSEALMGYSEGKSMLYLETRCIYITRGAGVQGLQNGAVSCIGMPGALPGGIRAVLGENLIAMLLDLECASANDQTFSHSDIRRTARTLMQMLPGTDFIFSGYSAVPNYDNMFAGSNFDAEDFDDYNILQRDLKVDGGLRPISEDEVIKIRNKAAKAIQGLFKELDLPEITDEEVYAATYAHGSKDMPVRDVVQDLKGAEELLKRGITGLDLVKALSKSGFKDVAENVLNMLKQRVSGDYLQTSAILNKDFKIVSAINDKNDYMGPGSGYRISEERWNEISNIPTAIKPESIG